MSRGVDWGSQLLASLTPAQRAGLRVGGQGPAARPATASPQPSTAAKRSVPGDVGRGRMNKTETRYSLHLEARRLVGEISRWDFEPVTFRLAKRTRYTPDFRVVLTDGSKEWHEVKGSFMREKAWIKLKLAAELHPERFLLCRWVDGAWQIGTVTP